MKIDVRKLELLQARECLKNKELVKKAQIGLLTLAKIKRGDHETRLSTIGKIAKALNCDVVELLAD